MRHGRAASPAPTTGGATTSRGRLVGIYGEESHGPLDRDTHGLTALPTAERGGFVFTVLTPGAPMDIDAWLGDCAEELDKLGLADWHVFSRRELVGRQLEGLLRRLPSRATTSPRCTGTPSSSRT